MQGEKCCSFSANSSSVSVLKGENSGGFSPQMDGNVNLKEENCCSFFGKSSLVAGLKGENSGGFSF